MASRVHPAFASRSTSLALARAVGARPLYFPSAAALAMPSLRRSNIRSRSNVAIAPSMVSISLPVALGHHQHVTLAHEFEGRGQLGAVCDG